VISDSASFFWDVRVIPQDNSTEILNEFEKYCRELEDSCKLRFPDFKITTIEHHPDVPPLDTPDNLEIVSIIQDISGRTDLGTVAYAAEAGQFSNAGFQTVICGPGDIAQAHRANEFVEKKQLDACCTMLRQLIKKQSI